MSFIWRPREGRQAPAADSSGAVWPILRLGPNVRSVSLPLGNAVLFFVSLNPAEKALFGLCPDPVPSSSCCFLAGARRRLRRRRRRLPMRGVFRRLVVAVNWRSFSLVFLFAGFAFVWRRICMRRPHVPRLKVARRRVPFSGGFCREAGYTTHTHPAVALLGNAFLKKNSKNK